MSEEKEATPETAEAAEENSFSQLQADLERFRDLALRSQADFDNFRKRSAREKEDAIKYANSSLLERLIPIIDNFELGLAHAGDSPIAAGLSMVARQFNDFLSDSGVVIIDATGQPFDPNLHEAIAQEKSATVPEGTVIRQVRKGFKLKDRLLRPANVIVSKGA
ncbi:MAG TPA: nucleotide exchange factor GrpE [Chthoniobacteraceae bacterium]|jgi:molecular chaperone GrpE|nr:nucleotide exchange factor GrpE [Chthoniobacteraceae bacterium]